MSQDMTRSLVCLGVDLIITDRPSMVERLPFCSRDIEFPFVCDRSYSPVCGSDGITYSNQCSLNFYSCQARLLLRVVHEGKCSGGGWG